MGKNGVKFSLRDWINAYEHSHIKAIVEKRRSECKTNNDRDDGRKVENEQENP